LTPTVIYVKKVVELHEKVGLKGVVHITGGGMTENIPRVIPKGLGVAVKVDSYQVTGWLAGWLGRWLPHPGREVLAAAAWGWALCWDLVLLLGVTG
jgi:phosphoribosylformylglycinamidine cyclo-ligase